MIQDGEEARERWTVSKRGGLGLQDSTLDSEEVVSDPPVIFLLQGIRTLRRTVLNFGVVLDPSLGLSR